MKNTEIYSLISNNSEERLLDYQNNLINKAKEVDQNLSRINLYMLLTVLIHTIVSKTKVTSIELGPFTLSDFEIISKLTPLTFAYLLFQFCAISNHKAEINKAMKLIGAYLYKQNLGDDNDIYEANFIRLILPFSIWSEMNKLNQTKSLGCIGLLVTLPGLLILLFIPFYFQYNVTTEVIRNFWKDPISKFTVISSIWLNICTIYSFVKLFQQEMKAAQEVTN